MSCKWTNVNEVLPIPYQWVLCCGKAAKCPAHLQDVNTFCVKYFPAKDNKPDLWHGYEGEIHSVTHWMVFPQPPI